MKLIVLIAGRGHRIESEIGAMPKALIEFGGQTITERVIEQFATRGSIDEIGLCVGYKAEQIRERVGDDFFGRKIRYFFNKDYETTGAAWSLAKAKDFFSGEECVIMEGDHLFHPKLVKLLLSNRDSHILVDDSVEPEYGEETVLLGDSFTARGLVWPASTIYEHDKFYVLGEAIVMVKLVPVASRILANSLGKGEIIEPLNEVFRRTLVWYSSTDGLPWIEIDTPIDLKRAHHIYKECGNG